MKKLKVHEKGVGHRGKKSNIKSEIKEMAREIEEEPLEGKKEIGLIEAADNALKNRVVQRDQMQKFIEKKREMFLMQMNIDQKKEQIKQLEEVIAIRNKGLEKAEQNIQADLATFNAHLKTNKTLANNAIRLAGQIAEQKNKEAKTLKDKKDERANEFSKNSKQITILEEMFKYKKLVDELGKAEDINSAKQAMQHRLKPIKEELAKRGKTCIVDLRAYCPGNADLKDLEDLINDPPAYYDPPLKSSEEIIRSFQRLEEENLRLIRNKQDFESEMEDLIDKQHKLKEDYERQIKTLEEKKKGLEEAIKEKSIKYYALNKTLNDSKQDSDENSNFFKEIKTVYQVLERKGDVSAIQMMTVTKYVTSGNRSIHLEHDKAH